MARPPRAPRFVSATLFVALVLAVVAGTLSTSAASSACAEPSQPASETVLASSDTTYDVSTAKVNTNYVISGSGTYGLKGSSTRVSVAINPSTNGTVTVYLEGGLSIDPTWGGRWSFSSAPAISIGEADGATVSLVIRNGADVYLGGYRGAPAIRKNGTATHLVIKSEGGGTSGKLTAVGSSEGSCVGIGSDGGGGTTSGNITFESGTIVARGHDAPGIGCKDGSLTVTNVSITGGDVSATGGGGNSAGIGSGKGGNANGITISGGTVTATGSGNGAGIGGGSTGAASGITISGGTVTARGGSRNSYEGGAGIGSGAGGTASRIVITGGIVSATGGTGGAGIGGGSQAIVSDITIGSESADDGPTVEANGGTGAAGIGTGLGSEGGQRGSLEIVSIHGGTVEATGSSWGGAGIGAGSAIDSCGNIVITGGTVRATGGQASSGIGSVESKSVDWIWIRGGRVTATRGDTGGDPDYQHVGDIGSVGVKRVTVSGGTVDATITSGEGSRVVVSGGSIRMISHSEGASAPTSRNGGTAHRTVVTLEGVTEVTGVQRLVVGSKGSLYEYGYADLYTFDVGGAQALVLYLPEDTYAREAIDEDGSRYTGNVYPGQEGMLRLEPNITLSSGSTTPDGLALGRNGASSIYIYDRPVDFFGRGVAYYVDELGNKVADANGVIYGTGSIYTSGGVWTSTANVSVTLWAVWEPGTFTLAFDSNMPYGASTTVTGETSSQTVTIDGDGQSFSACGFVLPGYRFVGWNTEDDGSGDAYAAGQPITQECTEDLVDDVGDTVTLYAQWEPYTYEVTFEAGGGTGTMGPQELTFDEEDTLALNGFGPPGTGEYTPSFLCWEYGEGQTASNGAEVTNLCTLDDSGVPQGRTLTARWSTSDAVVITLTNNGSPVELDSPSTDIVLIASDDAGRRVTGFAATDVAGVYQVRNVDPGPYFVDVSDEASGFPSSGAAIEVKDGQSNSFALNYCTITVRDADGEHVHAWIGESPTTPGETTRTVFQGTEVTVRAVVDPDSPDPYTFAGYDVKGVAPAGLDASRGEAQAIVVTGEVTLTARARPVAYEIAFDSNYPEGASTKAEASGDMAPMTGLAAGEEYELTRNAFALPGYAFVGWGTSPSGADSTYGDAAEVRSLAKTDGETVTLYARWRPVAYTVRFDSAGGEGAMNDQTFAFDGEGALSSNAYSREGYTFLGWGDLPEAGDVRFGDGERVSNLTTVDGGVVTFYAQWERDTYAVHFDKNADDAAGTTSDETLPTGDEWAVPGCGFTRTGYAFLGWNTKADGSGTKYSAGDAAQALGGKGATVTLYAQWKAIAYSVAFDANVPAGASTAGSLSGSMTDMTCRYGDSATLPANGFSLPGYAFSGWNTAPDGTGTGYGDGATVSDLTTEDGSTITLYAQWEPYSYEVTFDAGDGTGTMDAQTLTFDEPAGLPACAFANEGYSFLGWRDASTTGTASLYGDGATVVNLCDLDDEGVPQGRALQAVWSEQPGVYVILTKDDEPVALDSPASEITLVPDESPASGLSGFSSTSQQGTYYLADVPAGTYGIDVGGYPSGGKVSVSEGTTVVFLGYSTITVSGGSSHVKVSINEGTPAQETSLTVLTGSAVTISAQADVGYVFERYTSSGVTPADLDPSEKTQTVGVTGTVTLTVHERAAEYYVTFDANVPASASTAGSLSGSVPPLSVAYGEGAALPDGGFELPGYEFAGWNGSADGTGEGYDGGETVENLTSEDGGTVELFAQWRPLEYEVTFGGGEGASGSMGPQEMTFDEPAGLLACAFVNDGNSFLGWSTPALGSCYADEETVVNLCTLGDDGDPQGYELTATWKAASDTCVIITENDLPSYRPAASDVQLRQGGTTYDGPTSSSAGVFVYAGALPTGEFEVWVGGKNTGRTVTSGGVSRIDYYTVEAAPELGYESVVRTWLDDGSGERLSSLTVLAGTSVVLGAEVSEGYVFEEYSAIGVAPTWGGGGPSQMGQDITINGKVLVEAHARAAVYRVAFDANGAEGSMEDQYMVYGEPQGLFANAFTRAGYDFAGWSLTADGGGTTYGDAERVENLLATDGGVVTLYAQWSPVPSPPVVEDLPVSFVSVGHGTLSVNPERAQAGEAVTVIASPDEGYGVYEIRVTDGNGAPVPVTQNDDGTCSFVMPGTGAKVETTFKVILPFPDLTWDHWAYDDIALAYERGLMTGYASGDYGADDVTNRAMAITVIWRFAGRPQATGDAPFSDVDAEAWYADAARWAYEAGVVTGYEGTDLLGPEDELTREQLVVMLMRFASLQGMDVSARADLSAFPDGDGASPWARDAVEWAVAEGLLRGGETTGELDPQGGGTRAALATLVMRYDTMLPVGPLT